MTDDFSAYPRDRATAKTTGATHYFTGLPCKYGHITLRVTQGACITCKKEQAARAYVTHHKDWLREYAKTEASRENKRRWYEKNKERVIAKALARTVEDKTRYRAAWKANNPDKVLADGAARKRRNRDATPAWLTSEDLIAIRRVYAEARQRTKDTGVKHSVDHIIPLRGDEVSGLHVPWNLRVVTHVENSAKHNQLPPEEEWLAQRETH